MKRYNGILLQLNKAVGCANSIYPQEKGIAVILLDNLIELELYKIAKNTLLWDEASIDGGRAIDKVTRDNIVGGKGKYDRLIKFSKDNALLTESEMEILKFGHELRNVIYHQGEDDELKIEIGLLIYYGIIKVKMKKWADSRMFSVLKVGPAYEKIDFGQGIDKNIKSFERDHKKYFETALDYLLSKWDLSKSLDETIILHFLNQIRRIKSRLSFIESNIRDINYYRALGSYWYLNDLFEKYVDAKRKPKNIDSVMITSHYLREYKDYLGDINDLNKRQKTGRSLYFKHRRLYKGKYSHWVDLSRIEKRVNNLRGKNEHTLIKTFIEIQNKLRNLYLDVGEAASNLDGYIQDMTDNIRGK